MILPVPENFASLSPVARKHWMVAAWKANRQQTVNRGPFFYDPMPPTTPGGGGGSSTQDPAIPVFGNSSITYPTPQQTHEVQARISSGTLTIPYGRCKVPGLPVYARVVGSTLHVVFYAGEGEIDGYEAILVDDVSIATPLLTSGAATCTEYAGQIFYETYTGSTAQPVCSLSIHDTGYVDANRGTAYVYMQFQSGATSGFPEVDFILRGRKLYDPRHGGTVYSTNPALVLADLRTSQRYGAHMASSQIDWASVASAANYCDLPRMKYDNQTGGFSVGQVVAGVSSGHSGTVVFDDDFGVYGILTLSGATGAFQDNEDLKVGEMVKAKADGTLDTVPRYAFNAMVGGESLDEAEESVRRHFLGAVFYSGALLRVEVARCRPVVASFDEATILPGATTGAVRTRDRLSKVTYTWTDPASFDTVTGEMESPDLVTGGREIVQGNYPLPGFQLLKQATRVATFLLNSRLSDLPISFVALNDKGLEPLDVFEVTYAPLGLTAKRFYAVGVQPLEDGTTVIEGKEYDPAMFAEQLVTEPTFPDTNLPKPTDIPPDVTDLQAIEHLAQLKDKTWVSSLSVTWEPSACPFVRHYAVYLKAGAGSYVLQGVTTGTEWEVRAVEELVEYTVKVVTVTTFRRSSAGATVVIKPDGKMANPVWKAGAALSATESGDKVILKWAMSDGSPPAVDIDIAGYEVRRSLVTEGWDQAAKVCEVDALALFDKSCPAGAWLYHVRAFDTTREYRRKNSLPGGYTETSITAQVTVTLNPYLGFQKDQEINLGAYTAGNGAVFDRWSDAQGRRIDSYYNSLENAWSAYPGTTWAQEGDGLWCFPCGTSSWFLSGQVDLQAVISGRFSVIYQSEKIGTAAVTLTPKLLLSENGTDWTEHNASSVIDGKGRYLRVRFEQSGDGTAMYRVYEPVTVNVLAETKKEEGEATITGGGSGYADILFLSGFIAIEKVDLQQVAVTGTTYPAVCLADNVSTTGFRLKVYDMGGNVPTFNAKVKYTAVGY